MATTTLRDAEADLRTDYTRFGPAGAGAHGLQARRRAGCG